MARVNLVDGDITQVKSDALITAINSSGMWFGGIDNAIYHVAGDSFHRQVASYGRQYDGCANFATGRPDLNLQFSNVIFVINDLKRPLREIMTAGLNEAEVHGLTHVTMPTIRTGVMAGAYERTIEAALDEMAFAISEFCASNPQHVELITVVTFRDQLSLDYLTRALGLIAA